MLASYKFFLTFSDRVRLIDWESTFKFPEVYDAAVLFDRNGDRSEDFDAPDSRLQWIKTYLSTHPVHGQSNSIPTELLDSWYVGSVRASVISTFNIVVFLLLQAIKQSHVTADFLGLAVYFYKRYQKYKRELEGSFPSEKAE